MNFPLVTIVTPSFNQGQFIRATIESVLRQDYPNIEYIIMDGGSTDETRSIAGEYSSRLTFLSESDSGQSHAINKGFKLAKGEILFWLNSDDIILDGAVSTAARALAENPDAGAVYGEGYRIDKSGEVIGRFPHTEPFNLWKLVYLSDYVLQQTVYIRKSVLDEVGFLDENLHYALDWDLLIRIGKRYRLHYIPEYMGCIREYPEAKSFAGGAERIREIARVLRKHTGQRVPPGLIVYGIETYRRIWCGKIERFTPPLCSFPSRVLQSVVMILAGRWIERTTREAQGWHSDGWASPRLHFMLPPGEGMILVEGEVPRTNRRLRGQTLEIFCNRTWRKRFQVPPGDFQFHFQPPSRSLKEPVMLEIRASRHVVPALADESPPRRRLAYILKRIEWGKAQAAGA